MTAKANGFAKGYQVIRHQCGKSYADLDWTAFANHQDRQLQVNLLAANPKCAAIICSNAPFGVRLPFGVLPSEDDLPNALDITEDPSKRALKLERAFRQPELLDVCDFMQLAEKREYIIENLIVEGQPGLWAGDEKSWKTTLALWAAASIGLGIDFLGFKTSKRRVAFYSAESGSAVLQEILRDFARQHGADIEDADLLLSEELPDLSTPERLTKWAWSLCRQQVQLLFADPAYLMPLGIGSKGRDAASLFNMGDVLGPIGEIGRQVGCTIILVHHNRKRDRLAKFAPPELGDIAYAGFSAWARQWVLLGHRAPATHADGRFRGQLWLNAGGSSGHGGNYALDVIEAGKPGDRSWRFDLRTASELDDHNRARKAQTKAKAKAVREREKISQILAFIVDKPGESKTAISEAVKCSRSVFDSAVRSLVDDGLIAAFSTRKGGQNCQGWNATEKGVKHAREHVSLDTDVPSEAGQAGQGGQIEISKSCPASVKVGREEGGQQPPYVIGGCPSVLPPDTEGSRTQEGKSERPDNRNVRPSGNSTSCSSTASGAVA